MDVCSLTPLDHDWWIDSRHLLFDTENTALLAEEERQIAGGSFRGMPCVVLIARAGDKRLGFAEVGLRSGAEGCMTSPVCYLEAWWVDEHARGCGVGRLLVEAAAGWGRAHGCREMASDTETHNAASQAAHRALGFDVLEPIICFRKRLD